MDEIIKFISGVYPNVRITYNKHHIAIGTEMRNFMWFHPRKTQNNCHFEIKIKKEDFNNETRTKFDELGISYTLRREDVFAISMQTDKFRKNEEKITQIINQSLEAFS